VLFEEANYGGGVRQRQRVHDEVVDAHLRVPVRVGTSRDLWLATAQRGRPARVVAEAETAEETFEAVASGLGVALLSAGNAGIYRRADVVFLPVTGLPPSELAIAWRTAADRSAIRVFVDACAVCLCGGAAVTPPPTPVPTR
jgi:DNA-binding transcriptional LysR family regulator